MAGQGMARLGEARQGKARQGFLNHMIGLIEKRNEKPHEKANNNSFALRLLFGTGGHVPTPDRGTQDLQKTP